MSKTTVRLFMTAAIAAMMTSCSSNTTSEDQGITPENQGTPMRFSAPAVGTMETRTRASEPLKSGFLVSTYKNGTISQQEVMNQYEAKYSSDPWNTTNTSWKTVGTVTDGFYQEQFEKYWDTSAYPYEFLAIAPAPIENKAIKTGFEVTAHSVKLAAGVTGQTVSDGTVTPASPDPEYLVAHLERKRKSDSSTQTEDIDRLTGTTAGSNTSPTGSVPLPFHHLSSRVRFGIYTTEPVSESQKLPITNVSFKVSSANTDGFVTKATGYEASNVSTSNNALSGTFTGLTKSTEDVELLKFTGPYIGTEEKFPDAYLQNHEWNSKQDVNAYYFECKDGFTQVPQGKVKLTVSFTITTTTGTELKYTNEPLKITDANGNEVNEFTWEPNHLYTYYIVVRKLLNHDISFTATVADWEDVNGNIETNLEE